MTRAERLQVDELFGELRFLDEIEEDECQRGKGVALDRILEAIEEARMGRLALIRRRLGVAHG